MKGSPQRLSVLGHNGRTRLTGRDVGHLLVATRAHRKKVADMESRESQEIGEFHLLRYSIIH